jgi:hypothetical protein
MAEKFELAYQLLLVFLASYFITLTLLGHVV